MKDFALLKIIDRFKNPLIRAGIDYPVLRKILQVKLTLDSRRVPTIFAQNDQKEAGQKKDSNQFYKSLWIYVLFSIFIVPFILMGNNFLFQMSLFFGLFTFFVMMTMVSDFSSVLLDVRDLPILLTKPVGKRTVAAAKIIHIASYIFILTVAIGGVPLIAGLMNHGPVFFAVTALNLILIDLLVIVCTALIYMLILKYFDGEKLKDIINFVQIGLSLAIVVGYQLLIRAFDFIDMSFEISPAWWQVLIFPLWNGSMVHIVMKGAGHPFYLFLAVLGVLIPIIAIIIYAKLVTAFENNLQKLAYGEKEKGKEQGKLSEWLLGILCNSREERAFYEFAGIMMKKEREFKLKVYPSLGFSLIFPLIFFLDFFRDGTFSGLRESNNYLTIYFSFLFIPSVVLMLRYSGNYKGAWVYKISPLEDLRAVFSGTMKAYLTQLFLPLYLLLCTIFLAIFGMRILPDLVFVFINGSIYAVLCFLLTKKHLPFSETFSAVNQNTSWLIFGLLFIVPVFALVHYLAMKMFLGIYLFIVISATILVVLWKYSFRLTWDEVSG